MAQVNVTNINVNVQSFQAAYTNLGLGPIPPGTTVSDAVAAVQKKLAGMLQDKWPKNHSHNDGTNEDSAVMAPWSANIPGSAPKCATDAISLDFKNWNLPVDSATITDMAQEITQQISNHGGVGGTFYGLTKIASSKLYWGVGFQAAPVVDGPPEQLGIIYAFSAVVDY
jgi:hypothetical protein